MTDTQKLYGFILFFIVSGLVISWLNGFFEGTTQEFDTDSIIEGSKKEITVTSSTTLFRTLLEIVKMSIWTFGSVPTLVDLILFVPLRLVFWFLIVKTALGSGS